MLISLTIENWMSFREPVTLSMVASRERQHGHRLARIPKHKLRLLPITAIYGGNASGKTNLFRAIRFLQSLVVDARRPDKFLPVEPYRLVNGHADKPSNFTIELLIDETIFELYVSVTRKAVIEEKLTRLTSTSETTVYHRHGESIDLEPRLDEDERMHFIRKGTRDNQLFLSNSVSQRVDEFRPIYNWFNETLELVAPDSRFGPFERFLDEGSPLMGEMGRRLQQLDTGVSHLGGEDMSLDIVPIPDRILELVGEELEEGMSASVVGHPYEQFILTSRNGELHATKLITFHRGHNGEDIKFEMESESDGTRRIIDLLPAFLELTAHETHKVYVIDELDRSLHTLLQRRLLEFYLETCDANTKSQLLFTTHNVMLMDQELLRRDEMWITERDATGNSRLIALSEYKGIRHDKDIRRSYLRGYLGGIPRVFLD